MLNSFSWYYCDWFFTRRLFWQALAMVGACDAQNNSKRALQNTNSIEQKLDKLIKLHHDKNDEKIQE
jgi:hypothetical protein